MPTVLNDTVTGLVCVLCGAPDPSAWTCPECGPEGRMDVRYAPDAPALMASRLGRRAVDLWRYRELLPATARTPLHTGGTPLYDVPALARYLGLRRVLLKDEGRNPTGSVQDRAMAVAVGIARAGSERIACASDGEAALSMACQAASVGLGATVFVSPGASEATLARLGALGAQVVRVGRPWELCSEVAARMSWFDANVGVNPYLVEGAKTLGLEVGEQGGAPDWVVVPAGHGATIAGVVKGLEAARAAGLIARVPRVLGVQAAGASPLVQAAERHGDFVPGEACTVADALSVGHPRDAHRALLAVARVKGAWVAVSDEELLDAVTVVGRLAGALVGPAGGAAVAGVRAGLDHGHISTGDSVCVVLTGAWGSPAGGAVIDAPDTVQGVIASL